MADQKSDEQDVPEAPNPEASSDAQGDTVLPGAIDIDRLVDEHEEEIIVAGGKTERRKGIYLLPNLFTTAALFAGFYAIIAAMRGDYESGAIAIFVAGFLDGLDGRVARMTNTSSKFGAEYDSLADMVSFGVAPSLVVFSWALTGLGKFGWSVAFIYVACAALRLARFNTQIDSTDKAWFTGLASPAAAGTIAATVWVCTDIGWVGDDLPFEVSVLVALLTGLIGVLMIVNIRYYSFKTIDLHGRVPFAAIILLVLIFGLVTADPPRVLLGASLLYALSGPLMMFRKNTAD